MEPLRIVLYSHDSVGLGHVRRNLVLAHALANQLPGLTGRPVTGILITGTPHAPGFPAPEGWDWVLLPGVGKSPGGYLPRNLSLPMAELVTLRSKLLKGVLGRLPARSGHRGPTCHRGSPGTRKRPAACPCRRTRARGAGPA